MNIVLTFIFGFIIAAATAPIDEESELVLGESDGNIDFGKKLNNRYNSNNNKNAAYKTLYLQQFDIPGFQVIDHSAGSNRKIRVAEPQYYENQGYGNQGGYGYSNNYGGTNRRPGYGSYGNQQQYGQNYGGYQQQYGQNYHHQQNHGYYRG